jgi:DnaK suppressor protein
LEQARLDVFRQLLDERKNALLRDVNATETRVEEREILPDDVDLATEESSRDFAFRLQDRERRLLHKIHEALQRVADGSYGVCEACGENIDERRLMARPVATHCIDCKTEAEQLEGRRRAF